MGKTALITGITGQDGLYLARFLLQKKYTVHGLILYGPHSDVPSDIKSHKNFTAHHGDVTDASSIQRLINTIMPDEIYNLAAQSHVQVSFDTPIATAQINGIGVVNMLEALRACEGKSIRFYQAGSSEMFGNAPAPQNEDTPLRPCSPYGAAKAYAHHMVRIYREAYDLFAVNGILFNHESPGRGDHFVTQKIIKAAVAIAQGEQDILYLGNIDAERDWGHAADYVRGMWLMLQQDKPDDYVLATGQNITVRAFAALVFAACGHDIEWSGQGVDMCGKDKQTGKILIRTDKDLYRPLELSSLRGDATKAHNILGWQPNYDLDALIDDMLSGEGFTTQITRKQQA